MIDVYVPDHSSSAPHLTEGRGAPGTGKYCPWGLKATGWTERGVAMGADSGTLQLASVTQLCLERESARLYC